jgi:uncharacterized protein (DUF1800 family)
MNDQVVTQDAEVAQDTHPSTRLGGAAVLATVASAALAACGGGGGDTPVPAALPAANGNTDPQALLPTAGPINMAGAWRFLNRATMGPTPAEVSWVATYGIEAWLEKQFAIKQPKFSYADKYVEHHGSGDTENINWMTFTWWNAALSVDEQLRTRVVNALSEILVVSMRNDTLSVRPIMVGAFWDMLAQHAFGNFRQLIEAVCKSPAMGIYLSHLGNEPPSGSSRVPDQNFSRELLQLFTLGLTMLEMDGSPVRDANGRNVNSTTKTDIPVLSNVFTGWAIDDDPAISTDPKDDLIYGYGTLPPNNAISKRIRVPMKGYMAHHSTDALINVQLKSTDPIKLLGESFSLSTTSPQDSLTAALDIIFRHQNVAPFIARQMIQRLVTSNPSSGYIKRVAVAFKDASWDMRTLIRAVLTDSEARDATVIAKPSFGKLREPIFRVAHLLRAFGVTHDVFPGETHQVASDQKSLNLNQSPMFATSVFNFFSPTYAFVGGGMAKLNLVTPEMQIATEASVVAYVNAVYEIVDLGLASGAARLAPVLTDEAALAATPAALVASINTKLFGGTMSSALQTEVTKAATAAGTSASASDKAKAALFLAAVSPEYLVQK